MAFAPATEFHNVSENFFAYVSRSRLTKTLSGTAPARGQRSLDLEIQRYRNAMHLSIGEREMWAENRRFQNRGVRSALQPRLEGDRAWTAIRA
jgi:hypothetical protein